MLAFVVVLQILVALFMILVVLLQPGNRGGAGAALGGAGGDTVFGGRGANTFLAKLTFGAAVCFMVTNMALSYMSSPTNRGSVTDILENQAPSAPSQDMAPGEEKPNPAGGGEPSQPSTEQPEAPRAAPNEGEPAAVPNHEPAANPPAN